MYYDASWFKNKEAWMNDCDACITIQKKKKKEKKTVAWVSCWLSKGWANLHYKWAQNIRAVSFISSNLTHTFYHLPFQKMNLSIDIKYSFMNIFLNTLELCLDAQFSDLIFQGKESLIKERGTNQGPCNN